MKQYKILINKEACQKVASYLKDLQFGTKTAGNYLNQILKDKSISQVTIEELIELLIGTKQPQIFAESAVYGDGTDWNQTELSILGDISIATPVIVYDNGRHYDPEVHKSPFGATLLFTPGALLQNGMNNTPADWQEVTVNNQIMPEAYYSLYERRLLPPFIYANDIAKARNKKAFITIPGLGCGQFAGVFKGQMGSELRRMLITFLNKHGSSFSNIRAVYYDPYQECDNERLEINGISFFVRPLTKGNENKSQLCEPQKYEEGDDFSDCELFSFVAWDHVSWPGNDFYTGSRTTDDGVKAAATNSMTIMTGIEGHYNVQTNKFDPPVQYKNWQEVVLENNIQIQVKDNILIF